MSYKVHQILATSFLWHLSCLNSDRITKLQLSNFTILATHTFLSMPAHENPKI